MELSLERSDTLTIASEIFDKILQESSINGKFNSQDFREFLNEDQEEEPTFKIERTPSFENWNSAESDSGSNIHFKTEGFQNDQSFFPESSKKIVTCGGGGNILLIDDTFSNSAYNAQESVLVIDEVASTYEDNSIPTLSSMPVLTPSLSFHPWEGDLNFKIGVQTSTYGNSKWAYSNILKKLFLKPLDAVPIEVNVSSWIDGYINITPVFTSSQYKSVPVKRCHNHKKIDEDKKLQNADHIVQVDNHDVIYKFDNLRHSVDIPLGFPAPGESARLLFVKCGCWNTCTGGPDRKPFCLVFTLFSGAGEEIGRQILNLKVCACPVRDCSYSEKKFACKEVSKKNATKVKVIKKKVTCASKVIKKLKTEIGEQSYEQIMVPSDLADEVKKYINRLIAEKYAKENNLALPFPQF
ncbi:UNVERIFIED_CONTAM: hypothetical protein RMT77_004860 [Armadillidium vulgare]